MENKFYGYAAEAKQQVPSLVLVNGEDLTPYRQASKRIFSVLARFGTAERLGMDEVKTPVCLAILYSSASIMLGSDNETGHRRRILWCNARMPYMLWQ